MYIWYINVAWSKHHRFPMEVVNTLSSTPKKPVKPSAKKPDISNTCRLCYVHFKSSGKYRVSTENLFKTPQKSGVSSTPLAELVGKHVGVVIPQDTKKSSRVCAKCALKIRNATTLMWKVAEILASIGWTSFLLREMSRRAGLTARQCWSSHGKQVLPLFRKQKMSQKIGKERNVLSCLMEMMTWPEMLIWATLWT